MNWLDLANAIRRTAPQLPIILMTGYAEIRSPAEMLFPRLPKPYTQDQLAKILDTICRPAGG